MKYKYCPKCGHQNTVQEISQTKFICNICKSEFYNNPKAATSVVLLRGNEALFSTRKFDPDKGKIEFPGGFVDYGEDAFAACVREVKEELGLSVKPTELHLLTAYTGIYLPGTSTVDLIFLLLDWQGVPKADDDVESLEWKPLSFISDGNFIRPYFGLEQKIKAYTAR